MPIRSPHSIERILPLLLCLLLAVLIASFAWFSLDEVYTLATAAAEERLDRVVRQLAAGTERSNHQRLDETRAVAERPEVIEVARQLAVDPTRPVAEGPALTALRELADAYSQTEFIALANADGTPLFHVPGTAMHDTYPVRLEPPAGLENLGAVRPAVSTQPGSGGTPIGLVGPLRAEGERLFYEVWVPVGDSARHGLFLIQRRQVNTNPESIELIRGLIGTGSDFLYGNHAGDVWTDLRQRVPAPPPEVIEATGPIRYERPGMGTWYAGVARIADSPWVMLVEQPDEIVLTPARRTLTRIGLMAVATLFIGFAGALAISRRMTRPLRALTAAAEALARGDYSERVEVRRNDELGVLGASFNSMAAEVEDARSRLEERVTQRTAELREAQEELLRKEKLAVLGQVSGGIGHELRNPLSVMRNAVYLLQARDERLPEDVGGQIEVLDRQITLSEHIVDDLLGMTRVGDPEREETDLGELLRAQLDRASLPDCVTVELDLPADLPPVDVDPVQVGQIVYNLLINASQAMDERGTLRLRAAAEASAVRLEVADSGPGVEPEVADKVFEPLFTTKARGIGLGLSVSRALARANGGELALAPDGSGAGAAFMLTLPQRAVAVPALSRRNRGQNAVP